MQHSARVITLLGAIVLMAGASPLAAQVKTEAPPPVAGAPKARVEMIQVHSDEIAGNLLGTPADRDVVVILPPGYDDNPSRRYPVVYALHGYSIDAAQWIREIHLPQTAEGAFATGTPEMIIVLPSSKNVHNGAFYSNSVTTGNFENFIADELIRHVDARYRTLAKPESRGLVGHSMGGYGASRIGIRRAERFGALYLMAPCCQSVMGSRGLTGAQVAQLEAIESPQAAGTLPFGLRGTLALASAWSPNPGKPPLFVDLPVDAAGKERPEVLAKWAANAPLAFLDQYVSKVRRYRAIALDVGDKDGLVADTRLLHEALLAQGIPNTFEIYPGDHTSHVAFRFQEHVLPFFGRNLVSESPRIGERLQECRNCPELVVLPGGSFQMGSPADEPERDADEPRHAVTIPQPFAMAITPVTWNQWEACVRDNWCEGEGIDVALRSNPDGSRNPQYRDHGRGTRPAVGMSWHDAQRFVGWLNWKTGEDDAYRLPSEAEWEYAARAGTNTAYPWGSDIDYNRGNFGMRGHGERGPYAEGRDRWLDETAPVASFPPNAWGLHDMHGNVFEWTQDCYEADMAHAPVDGSASTEGDCSVRVFRNGTFTSNPYMHRSARRGAPYPATTRGRNYLGFRVAKSLQ